MSASRCPQCGAAWDSGLTCQDIFDDFLVHDYTDPGYGAVHALTVACYMVQHGQYSDEGLRWIARQLRAILEEGMSADELREVATHDVQPGRTWKVNRGPDDPGLPPIRWSMTIVDVFARVRDADSYRAAIRAWARVTLDEMQPLVSG